MAAALGGPSYPVLYFAVERNSPEIVTILCKAGADPSLRWRPRGLFVPSLPVLSSAVLSAEYDLSDITDMIIALLAMGKDPKDVPKDTRQEYIKAPVKDRTEDADTSNAQQAWCTSEVREALCRNLTLLQRYCLGKAARKVAHTPRMKQIAKTYNITSLFEAPYHMIGQRQTTKVLDRVRSHFTSNKSTPLVLLFTDPSGHGKTELANCMGDLLWLDTFTVDCASKNHETDLFGPQAPYCGYESSSPLKNHLAKWAGQRTIFFLDEFDKTTDEVRKAMLLLFEPGFYYDHRDD